MSQGFPDLDEIFEVNISDILLEIVADFTHIGQKFVGKVCFCQFLNGERFWWPGFPWIGMNVFVIILRYFSL